MPYWEQTPISLQLSGQGDGSAGEGAGYQV